MEMITNEEMVRKTMIFCRLLVSTARLLSKQAKALSVTLIMNLINRVKHLFTEYMFNLPLYSVVHIKYDGSQHT